MATNKNAAIRYKCLDKCFRNPGKRYYIDDLLTECNDALCDVSPNSSGIKHRQLLADIQFMGDSKGHNAPIDKRKDGRRTWYTYSDRNFSITSQRLNKEEAQKLQEALSSLKRIKGMPQFEWLNEMTLRLEAEFNIQNEDSVISFENNSHLVGFSYLSGLFNNIVNQQCIEMVYKSFGKDVVSMHVHPYFLKEYNNRWFLWALDDSDKVLKNFPLDRIKQMEYSSVKYIANRDIDFMEYFDDVVGVSVPYEGECCFVHLKIDSAVWPYIETKPIHHSQTHLKAQQTADYSFVRLKITPNFELEALLLSYGAGVEVLSPPELRNSIAERIKKSYKKYF